MRGLFLLLAFGHFDRDQDFDSVGATNCYGDDNSKSTAVYGGTSFNLSGLTLTAGLRIERKITNIEDAHSYGFEVEAYSMLGDQWQLHGGFGLLKTKIDESSAFPDAVGNDLNSAPELTASLGLSHWFTDSLKVNLSANYVDEFYGDLTNTEECVAGDYTITRLSMTYDTEQWLISAFINNALDEEVYTSQEPVSGRYPQGYVAVVNPQTIGASVTYRF